MWKPGPCRSRGLGGTRIDTGLDTNRDGVLESSEITETSYVCAVQELCVAGNVQDFMPNLQSCTFKLYESLESQRLAGANLAGVSLQFMYLNSTDFTGANLTGAFLYESELHNANFTNANLTNMNLAGADLLYAKMTGAITTGIVTDLGTICPNGSRGPCTF